MNTKITKRAVDLAQPADDRDVWLWDAELKGFGLRVRSKGRKVYVLEYRPGVGGRSAPKRRVTIGQHGSPWTPETARREAKRLLGAVATGGDPAAEKSDHKGAPFVADMAERFLTEHVAVKRKTSTAKEYRRLLELYLLPSMLKKRVADVVPRDLLKIHGEMSATPYQANRVLAVASAFFNFCALAGVPAKKGNPTDGVEPYPEEERERILSAREIAWLGEAMADAERMAAEMTAYEQNVREARRQFAAARAVDDRKTAGPLRRKLAEMRANRPRGALPPQALRCYRLLFFTGARLSEIQALRWPWVDFERGEARPPDSKTGKKTIHLPAPALEILANTPRVANNQHVIEGERPGAHFVGIQRPWRQIREAATVKAWAGGDDPAAAGLIADITAKLGRTPTFAECTKAAQGAGIELAPELSNLRIHDLRHAFASVAASSGMGLPIIGKMLGHTQASTTQRYAHLASDPVKAAAASVAGKIADAFRGGSVSEVIQFARHSG